MPLRRTLLSTIAALALAGCPRATPGAASDAGAGPAATGAIADASAPTAASADPSAIEAAPRKHPELRLMRFTSDVKDKEAVDVLDAAHPGKRVYAYLTVRNRTAAKRTLTVSFQIDGKERSTVDLEVEPSWSFRTWAYVTLKSTDKGRLAAVVKDDLGEKLGEAEIPIR
jgi:hypothetical protein